jgi:hypothetical protein
MIQIDSRIPEPPEYTYEVAPLPPSAQHDSELERKVSSLKPAARVLGKVDRAKDARKRTKDVRDTKTKE